MRFINKMDRINAFRTTDWRGIRLILMLINLLMNFTAILAVIYIPKEERNSYTEVLYLHGIANWVFNRIVLEFESQVQVNYISWAMFFRTLQVMTIIPLPIEIHHISNEIVKNINMYCYSPLLLSTVGLYMIWLCEINDQKNQYNIVPSEEPQVEQNQADQAPDNHVVEMNSVNNQ